MLLLQLIEEIRDTPSCIKFLRERFILRSIPPQCKICQRVMSEVKKNDINDGVVKSMSGTSEVLIPSYLNEFQWRQFFGKNENDAFNNILLHISQWYIVPH
jgi:hypothetical protein